jgi:transposase
MLNDELWSKLREIMLQHKIYDKPNLRKMVEAMLYRKKNSKTGNTDIDWGLYKYRHLVENVFARLKHFRAIATRYDKLKRNYASMLAMACSYIWLPM